MVVIFRLRMMSSSSERVFINFCLSITMTSSIMWPCKRLCDNFLGVTLFLAHPYFKVTVLCSQCNLGDDLLIKVSIFGNSWALTVSHLAGRSSFENATLRAKVVPKEAPVCTFSASKYFHYQEVICGGTQLSDLI